MQCRQITIHGLGVFLFYSLLYLVFFSPAIFSGRLLAPGDGMTYYLPNFFSKRALWEPLLASGFPMAADPQAMTWYPLALIFSLLRSWNGFILSAYVLASCFTYGYVFTLTQTRIAGIVSGTIFGMSGFMMAHLGHTTVIHTAIWLPLLIWAMERIRTKITPLWFIVATLSVACGALAGHPQIFVYAMGITSAYVLFRGWPISKKHLWYYGSYGMIGLFGLSIAAIQLLPTTELTNLGMRSQMTFTGFKECSFPPHQSIALLFPYLFGGNPGSFYLPYFGPCNIHELSGYVGLLPFMLAGVCFLVYLRKPMVWFWSGAALIAFLLTLGDATPFAKLMYYLPAYNKFRAPARHFIEMTFAVSILAGFGVSAIQSKIISKRSIFKIIGAGTGVMLMGFTAIYIFSNKLQALALNSNTEKISIFPWSNPAIGLPLGLFLASCIIFFYWSKSPHRYFQQGLLLSILIIDLSSFGWFMQWRYGSPSKELLDPPAIAQKYKKLLDIDHQRFFPIRGAHGVLSEIPVNISRLWGVPSASYLGPMTLSRMNQLLNVVDVGKMVGLWSNHSGRGLDILAVRYIFLPRNAASTQPILHSNGLTWLEQDLPILLGSGCGIKHSNSIRFYAPSFNTTAVGLVSSMSCSADVPEGAEVVRILITDGQAKTHIKSMRAGYETSEWAHDCTNAPILHKKAPIFKSFLVTHPNSSSPCEAHRYFALLRFKEKIEINQIEFQWVSPSGLIEIQKISLIDEQSGKSHIISAESDLFSNPLRWRHLEDIEETSIYENLRAMPRLWLVPEVVSLKQEEVLNTIKSSQRSNGHPYDPSQTALVEEPLNLKIDHFDKLASAQVIHSSNTSMEIHTNSTSPSFLILSDVYYPGWKATIDGIDTHIFRTNYILRGIMVPQGGHVIKFEFTPVSFNIGFAITLMGLVLLISGVGFLHFSSKQK